VESKATIRPFVIKKIMADDSNEEETGSQRARQLTNNKGSNRFYKRGAYRGSNNKKNRCKETLQSSVTMFTNVELKIKVTGSPEQQRQ
jgi:hypothetical protein